MTARINGKYKKVSHRAAALAVAVLLIAGLLFTPANAAEHFQTEIGVLFQVATDNVATITVSWNDGWFQNRASVYNHELATTAVTLTGAAYVEENEKPVSTAICAALNDLGFENVQAHNYDYPLTDNDNDVVGYTFGAKTISGLQAEPTTLIAVVVKGTSENEEWYSNFNLGTGDTHLGFDLARNELMVQLRAYLTALDITTDQKGQVKFFVTGHSRGAAVANLVAAELTGSEYAEGGDVYGYTFAAPAVSTKATKSGYENIFNIVSAEDFITRIPLSQWGFGHYGVDLLLPDRSHYGSGYTALQDKMQQVCTAYLGQPMDVYNGSAAVDNVLDEVYKLAPTVLMYYNQKYNMTSTTLLQKTPNEYFRILADLIVKGPTGNSIVEMAASLKQGDYSGITGFFLENHKILDQWVLNNDRIFGAHGTIGYYSWMKSCTAEELFGSVGSSSDNTFKRMTVSRPSDIYVFGENGRMQVCVVGDQILKNELALQISDTEICIDFPDDQKYDVQIYASKNGTMQYSLQSRTAVSSGSQTLWNVTMKDIQVLAGDTLMTSVSTSAFAPTTDSTLMKMDTTGNTATLQPDHSIYTVKVQSTLGGTASASGTQFAAGERVSLTAVPNEGYRFKGWRILRGQAEIEDNSFTMPNGALSIEAVFASEVQVVSLKSGWIDVELNGNPAGNICCAVYDAQGRMLSAGTAAVTADAGVLRLQTGAYNPNKAAVLKVFYLDAGHAPIREAYEVNLR